MTHLLEIRDDEDTLLYNLLFATVGNAAITSLGSRQIIPLNDGRWEERFRIFSGSANMAPDVSCSILDLDKTVKSISDYGDNPAYNAPIWLYEKNEGEVALTRRAPLFSASQQPVQEGAIGQLLINSGYTGLLTIERGDWEDIELTTVTIFENSSPVVAFPPENTFGTVELPEGGAIDGRVSSLIHTATGGVSTTIIAAGIRETNWGVNNYQNCLSLGSGLADGVSSSTFNLISNGECTEPVGQSNTYNMVQFLTYVGAHTHRLRLSEVSGSSLDSINKDYVGEYDVYVRWANDYTASPPEWVKLTLSYGYDDVMIENDPVYTNSDASGNGWWVNPLLLGSISIPTHQYKDGQGATDSLADFTIALTAERVEDLGHNTEFWADSLFLIPRSKSVMIGEPKTVTGDNVDAVYSNPDGSYYATNTDKTNTQEVGMDMTISSNGGIVSYYRLANYDVLNSPTFNLKLNYYDRYNSTSG